MSGGAKGLRWKMLAVGVPILAVAAACGGSNGNSNSGSNGNSSSASSSNSSGALSLTNIGDKKGVLTSGDMTLYFTNDESSTNIKCTDSCTSVWIPATASDGNTPTLAGVSDLGTVKRPDGSTQLTYQSHPLYKFYLDTKKGDDSGDNAKDNFGGMSFHWTTAVTGVSAPAAPAAGSSPSGDDHGDATDNDTPPAQLPPGY